jgi:hypothetical protein
MTCLGGGGEARGLGGGGLRLGGGGDLRLGGGGGWRVVAVVRVDVVVRLGGGGLCLGGGGLRLVASRARAAPVGAHHDAPRAPDTNEEPMWVVQPAQWAACATALTAHASIPVIPGTHGGPTICF